MTPCQPYILRAVRQWIEDNHMTPYISVKAEYFDGHVAQQYAEDGLIALNISSQATKDFVIDADGISFQAHFGIAEVPVMVPTDAVESIYAEEDPSATVLLLQQASFEVETDMPSTAKTARKPYLKIVK